MLGKKKKNIIIILTVSITLFSCKKASLTHTIKGQFINCSNNQSINYDNTALDLFQQNNGSSNNSKVLANTTTDAQGNFTFSYSTTNTRDKLIIRASSGFDFASLMEGIPLEDISNLKVNIPPLYNLVISLNATNPFTNSDTLSVIRADSNIVKKIAGPFVSKRLFVWKNYGLLGTLNYGSNGAILQAGLNNSLNYNKGYAIENSKLCGDTVYVNIDVR